MKTVTTTSTTLTSQPTVGDLRSRTMRVILATAAALLMVASTLALDRCQGNPNPGVHPPQSKPYGRSYGQWAATYWQWLLSFPADKSPSFEEGDVVYGSQHQSGPVWILETGNSGVWHRNVHVPAGKAILFSVTGAEADTLALPGATPQDLLDAVTAPYNELTILPFAEVDGVPLQDLEAYLVTSPLFEVTVADPGLFGQPGGTGQAMAKGWFFVLAPLSKGHHTLRVSYHVVELPSIDGDTSYNLTVE